MRESERAMFASSSTIRTLGIAKTVKASGGHVRDGRLRAVAGELEAEARACADPAVDVDLALRLPHDRIDDRQAEPGALSGRLRGEERIENVLQVLAWNADAGVSDLDGDALRAPVRAGNRPRTDRERAAVRHRLHGVRHEIQNDLPHRVRVREAVRDGTQL